MSPEQICPLNDFKQLRKGCKHLLIDLELDQRGSLSTLVTDLSHRMSRPISRQTIGMALTGYRETEAYYQILRELKTMLETRLPANPV